MPKPANTLSPLTANIYLPAIPTMAAAFHKSTELINITVTVYMIFQGICELLILSASLLYLISRQLQCYGAH